MWLECIILRVASARFSRSTRFCRMVAGYFRVAFPFLFGGTFIEAGQIVGYARVSSDFPFLFGGTFIEALANHPGTGEKFNFPSFSEGLSLRPSGSHQRQCEYHFPSFSEGLSLRLPSALRHAMKMNFPFLFGGTFIEAAINTAFPAVKSYNFPSFSEGLSLRLF